MVPPGGGIKKPPPSGGQENKPDPLFSSVAPPVQSKPRAPSSGSDKADSVETSSEKKPATGGIGKLKVCNPASWQEGGSNSDFVLKNGQYTCACKIFLCFHF